MFINGESERVVQMRSWRLLFHSELLLFSSAGGRYVFLYAPIKIKLKRRSLLLSSLLSFNITLYVGERIVRGL